MTGRAVNPVLRLCYAAVHVVLRPEYRRLGHTLAKPGDPRAIEENIDWAATMRLRTTMDRHGLGVAEAMDTTQRFHLE